MARSGNVDADAGGDLPENDAEAQKQRDGAAVAAAAERQNRNAKKADARRGVRKNMRKLYDHPRSQEDDGDGPGKD